MVWKSKTTRRSKKKKSYRRTAGKTSKNTAIPMAMSCLCVGVCLFLFCSCLSFDIGDWPSRFVYPRNNPAVNWCGSIGAFCAYYLLYYVGPGIFVVLVSLICVLIKRLIKSRSTSGVPDDSAAAMVNSVMWMVGLALVTIAASTSFYCLWPHRVFNFPAGSGGVLGIGAAQFLRSHFAGLGTFILVAAIWIVGTLLIADSIIIMALHILGFAALKIIGVLVPALSVARDRTRAVNDIW
jgi:S-DNA-T family DNA segregation ATPase FtsK/SpoIIIE